MPIATLLKNHNRAYFCCMIICSICAFHSPSTSCCPSGMSCVMCVYHTCPFFPEQSPKVLLEYEKSHKPSVLRSHQDALFCSSLQFLICFCLCYYLWLKALTLLFNSVKHAACMRRCTMQAQSYNLKYLILLKRKKSLMINFDFKPQNETA